MNIKNKKGQSTVEYVLLVTAVLVVIIAFTSSTAKNGFQEQLNSTLNQVTQQMNSEAEILADSYAQPANTQPTTTAVVAPPYTVPVCPPGVPCTLGRG